MYAAYGLRRAAIASGLVGFALAATPAVAPDDGQASLIHGLATTFGITHDPDPQIDYRERAKLVVPRKMTLPPPAESAGDAAWPTSNEVLQEREAKKLDDANPSAKDINRRDFQLFNSSQSIKVTTSGFDRRGPSCRKPDPKTGECPAEARPSMNWNPMTWVGLEKKPKVELGPEPERQNLVDPPRGYRAPAEGVGAKIEQ